MLRFVKKLECVARAYRDDVVSAKVAAERVAVLLKEQLLDRELAKPPYTLPLRLERHGLKVYSQFDEDGIISEIFRRIGSTTKTFIEFGAETGLETNTTYLLLQGWRGLWMEGSKERVSRIESTFADVIESRRLAVKQAFITAENINDLIRPTFTGEIDLLSIDIDGNDFWVLRALDVVRPRLIVSEFNSKFPPPISIVPAYDPAYKWRFDDYMGASLTGLTRMLAAKGYLLVGTNFPGLNAFFVRNDLVGDRFAAPYTAEHHWNPPRYYLWQLYTAGHKPGWGRYLSVGEDGTPQT
jgi:hypothetical protein